MIAGDPDSLPHVRSDGGAPNDQGWHEVSHFVLDYDGILGDTDEDYYPVPGIDDGTTSGSPGTKITLKGFLPSLRDDEGPRQLRVVLEEGLLDL